MLLKKENLDIWYREYQEQYKRTTKYIRSRKGKIRDINGPMTRKEFEVDFRSVLEDNPKKSGKQIAQMMAKQELYTISWKQAKNIAEAHVYAFGGNVDINLIQQYRLETRRDVFENIQLLRRQMKLDGFDDTSIASVVSQEFFGSE